MAGPLPFAFVAHLLFVTLAGHGHVTPTLPLVGELVRRRHRVRYASGPEFGDAVEAAGATPVQLPGLAPFVPPPDVGPATVARWFRHFFAGLAATYPVLLAHCGRHRPDAIVYDATNWPARLVARELGIPAIRTVPNLAANDAYSGVDDALNAGLDDDPATTALGEDVAAFAAEHRVDLDVESTIDVAEALNLVFVPRAFQPRGETFDERFRFIGPVLDDRGSTRWRPPDPAGPVLYVSLGSIFTDHPEFYRTCLNAFDDGRWQVAMTVGATDPATFGAVPANVEVRSWFPQLDVLAHASAFLTHCGMGSTMEALFHGVPLLALPQMPEQAVNADRVVELRLGRRLVPSTMTEDGLRQAVEEIVDSVPIRGNLDRMRAEARAAGGASRGADAIEHHLTVSP